MNFLVNWKMTAGLVLALAVCGWLLRESYAANGALETKLSTAKAVIQQREDDMKLSALKIAELNGRVQQIDATAAPVRERIVHVPVTRSCGPVVYDAASGVQQLLDGAGGSAAGRQPVAAMRPPGAAGR
ncbi:MAG: hypothetical protein ACOY4R_27685 [Pseudomonadota bacterium]